jgi:hypothetical protein
MISPEEMALKIRKKFASKNIDNNYGNLSLEFTLIILEEEAKDKRPNDIRKEYWFKVMKHLNNNLP